VARLKASAKPTQPPSGADMNALVVRVDELSRKVLSKGFTSKLQLWKRWVGGEEAYDGTGLRDVVNTNALFTDQIKGDVDAHGQAILELKADVKALQEAPPARPFP
jgi:hypothetical protein